MKSNASLIYSFFLLVGDIISFLLAFVGAFLIRTHLIKTVIVHPVHIHTYIAVFAIMLPFWIILFALLGLYSYNIYEKRFNELGRLLVGSFIGMLFVVFWNYMSLVPILPAKSVPLIGFGLAYIFLVIFRNFARYVRTKLFSFGIGLSNALVVGNTDTAGEIVGSIFNSRSTGYKLVAAVGGQRTLGESKNVPLFKNFEEALAHIKTGIHTIIQTELYADETRNREILEYAQTHHIAYRFVPGNTELFVGNLDVELFRNSLPVIAVQQTALVGWGRIVKRIFDLIVGLILLIVTSPVMALVCIAELFSGGDVFFRQTRLTRFNEEFKVFKFRTVKKSTNGLTPEEAFTKMGKPELIKQFRQNGDQLPNDPRFSRLGNFLRQTSLDELPQLFNIIRGDISLVGPRALIPQELSAYEKRHAILSVKSGVTGLAQISGRKNISFEERRKLDLYYVQNWSFWLDLVILAKTVRVVLEGS